jgi:hypothetical protein
MRTAPDQVELRKWLDNIGMGLENGHISPTISIPKKLQSKKLDDLIDFCFPSEIFTSPLQNSNTICAAAILAPRCADVQRINDIAINRMEGDSSKFKSFDVPLEHNDSIGVPMADFNIEAINNETPSGFPPHILTLKVIFSNRLKY